MKIEKKKILLSLLKQYKQSVRQSFSPKAGDKITVNTTKLNKYIKDQGFAGKHVLSIIKKMLKSSGDNTLFIHSVKGAYIEVSGSKRDAILGTIEIPSFLINVIVNESKQSLKQGSQQILLKSAGVLFDTSSFNFLNKKHPMQVYYQFGNDDWWDIYKSLYFNDKKVVDKYTKNR